ncbi:hypothetical protein SARC_15005, partial [Sphaeroforma arctica JP610]
MTHVQGGTEVIHLIREQFSQLRELSIADIDTATPQDSVQTTSDADFLPKISARTPSDAVSSESQ